jgi:phosphoesterase RecJ-like protein
MGGAEQAHEQEQRLLGLIGQPGTLVITSHIHPDGDGIGSEVALAELARRLGASPRVVNADPIPDSLDGLAPPELVEVYDPARHRELFDQARAVLMLDNSDPRRLGPLEQPVRSAPGLKLCIDHHPNPDPFWQELLVRETATCTGEIVWDLYRTAGQELDPVSARALYVALVSDTGRFRFGNTTARGLRMAADLVEQGVRPSEMYTRFEERLSEGFLRLFGQTLARMEVRADGRLVLLRVPQAEMVRYGMEEEDTAEIINHSLMLDTSRISALFRDYGPGRTKISLRSKGALDVNVLARRHGGGGHRNASGVVLEMEMDEAVERLLPDLEALAGA